MLRLWLHRLCQLQLNAASSPVCRVKRLAALCANYDGVIAAGVYMTLKTPSSGSGSAAAAEAAGLPDMDSSGADSSDRLAVAAGTGAGDSTGESAVDEAEDAALAGGGATAAITRRLQSNSRAVSSSGGGSGSGIHPVGSDSGSSGASPLTVGGSGRQLAYVSGKATRAVLQADEAAAAEPDAALKQAVHRLNRLHDKMEAEGAGLNPSAIP